MRAAVLSIALLLTLAVAAPAATVKFFHSPSRNLDCLVATDSARCDVRQHTWTGPKRPTSCDLEWGSVLAVGNNARRGGFACVGDTARDPHAPSLPYGKSIAVGSMRCTSRTDGIRCRNRRGHGFLVGRTTYRLF